MDEGNDGINPFWRLSDPLTVEQAAALIAEVDPEAVRFNDHGAAWFENENGWTSGDGISKVRAAFKALVNAINGGNLPATIRHAARLDGWDEYPRKGESDRPLRDADHVESDDDLKVMFRSERDWGKTTVAVSDLRAWLERAGFKKGFFFPDATDTPDYLDPKGPRYAPKLAAAIKAWQAMTEPGPRTPKQALDKWLREHAAAFGLSNDDGTINETGVEEVAKVANWQPKGGAAKTPGA